MDSQEKSLNKTPIRQTALSHTRYGEKWFQRVNLSLSPINVVLNRLFQIDSDTKAAIRTHHRHVPLEQRN